MSEEITNTENEVMDESIPEEQEKMLPQSQVNKLVANAKLKGRDKMQDKLQELEQQIEQLKNPQTMGGMAAPVDENAIAQRAYELFREQHEREQQEQYQHRLEADAERVANEFHQKMNSGKQVYEDFDEVMQSNKLDPMAHPELLYLSNMTDDPAGIWRDLALNPAKLGALESLVKKNPEYVQAQMGKISASIKQNQQALANERDVNAPLSRIKSNPAIGSDDGKLKSVSDYKNSSRFRG